MQGTAIFKITSWQEHPFAEMEDGAKLTRASIGKSYSGEIVGEGILEYLMVQHADGSARFMGYEQVSGRVGDRQGGFVFQHSGVYENGEMRQDSIVMSGTATGELAGLQGKGSISAGHQQEYPMVFEYEFA